MFVSHVDMSMTQRWEIRITELSRERLLRICRKTGYVRSVVLERMFL